jgi:hypothetical protein
MLVSGAVGRTLVCEVANVHPGLIGFFLDMPEIHWKGDGAFDGFHGPTPAACSKVGMPHATPNPIPITNRKMMSVSQIYWYPFSSFVVIIRS